MLQIVWPVFHRLPPPDRAEPTSHFTIHAPTPTCLESCGTLDKGGDEEDTPTCETEANTDYHTRCRPRSPCKTVCNTYVGCACPTNTAIKYWVSCSRSSCTTTSSAVVTGCYVRATTTTTGPSCPVYGDVNPDDPQDDPAPASVLHKYP